MKDFMTGAAVRKRLKKERHELMEIVTDVRMSSFLKELTPYSPAYLLPLECWNPLLRDAHERAGTEYVPPSHFVERPGDIYDRLDEVLFKISDVEAYAAANPPKQTKRLSNKHKAAAREVAATLWKKDQKMTIEAVIGHDDVNKVFEGESYNEKTVRNWINDLCPNRKPGRRAAKK